MLTGPLSVSDVKRVALWRYEDPELGPRKIPNLEDPEKGKILIDSESVFHIDVDKQSVTVEENGTHFDIGYCLSYIVSS